jgi:hypothetical protein
MTWITDLSHIIDARTGQLPTNVPGPARRGDVLAIIRVPASFEHQVWQWGQ